MFALFYYFVFGQFFFKYKSPGAYIRRGDLTEGFFALRVGGGGYFWSLLYMGGLFSDFYGN